MNLKNLSRDAFWINSLEASDKVAFTTTTGNMASSGVVNDVQATALAGTTSGAGGLFGIGVLMTPPTEDRVPFRVKAYSDDPDNIYLVIGYAPSSPTGDDAIVEKTLFHIAHEIDEIFMLPQHASTHSYYNRPVAFGLYTDSVAATYMGISVQNLSVSPPQFGMAVS